MLNLLEMYSVTLHVSTWPNVRGGRRKPHGSGYGRTKVPALVLEYSYYRDSLLQPASALKAFGDELRDLELSFFQPE